MCSILEYFEFIVSNSLLSAPEADKGPPFSVYLGFHENLGLIS